MSTTALLVQHMAHGRAARMCSTCRHEFLATDVEPCLSCHYTAVPDVFSNWQPVDDMQDETPWPEIVPSMLDPEPAP